MSKLSNEEIMRRNKWAFYFLILFCVSGMCAGAYAHIHLEKEYQMYEALQKSYFQKCLKQYTHEKDIYECVRVEELKRRYD